MFVTLVSEPPPPPPPSPLLPHTHTTTPTTTPFVSGPSGFGKILGSRSYAWLRPDFVPPSPFLVVKDPQTQSSRILVEPHPIDAGFRKAWMPFFCRSGHPVVTVDQFLAFVGHLLPLEPQLDLPGNTGRDLQEVAKEKKRRLHVNWMVGLGLRLRRCLCLGFLVWLFSWIWLRRLVPGRRGLLDACIAMISEADGDSTPMGQRPLSVLPVVYWLWASLRHGHLREWVEGWLPKSVFSLGNGLSSVEAWFSTALDLEEVLSGIGKDQLRVTLM